MPFENLLPAGSFDVTLSDLTAPSIVSAWCSPRQQSSALTMRGLYTFNGILLGHTRA